MNCVHVAVRDTSRWWHPGTIYCIEGLVKQLNNNILFAHNQNELF